MKEKTIPLGHEQDYRSWDKTVEMLRTTHTLGMKRLCKMVHAHRPWVSNFILPAFKDDIIRLGTGLGTGLKQKNTCARNWAMLATQELKRDPESVFLPEEKVIEYIKKRVVSVTRQTRPVLGGMIAGKEKNSYFLQFAIAHHEDSNTTSYDILLDMLNEEHLRSILGNAKNRSKTKVMKCELEELPANWLFNMQTLGDTMTYGDAPEKIYRKFFYEGYFKVVIKFENPLANDETTEKVFYVAPGNLPHWDYDIDNIGELNIDKGKWCDSREYLPIKEEWYRLNKEQLAEPDFYDFKEKSNQKDEVTVGVSTSDEVEEELELIGYSEEENAERTRNGEFKD